MIEVEVLYADETRRSAPAADANRLPASGVLILFVHAENGSYRIMNDDWYVFGYKAPDEWFATGWDDFDDRVRVRSDAGAPGIYREIPVAPRIYPMGFATTIFQAQAVDSATWERLLAASEGIIIARNYPRGD